MSAAKTRGQWPPRLIGHRGAARHAPENTLGGLRKAKAIGLACVEFDVRLTRDGVPILLHDDKLDRTSSGKGRADALDFAEIERFDAGAWFAPEFRGERVPSLGAALALLGELELGAVIEVKGAAETGARAAALVARHWPDHLPPPVISSFDPLALAAARDAAPGIARALLVGAVPKDWGARLAALGATALHADQRRLGEVAVAPLAAAGIPLYAYTVNASARAAALFAWGVAGLFSDCPDALAAVEKPNPI